VARQSGVPASLHGTGGAWLVADTSANARRFSQTVFHSLDRKVCNTLNVCCIVRERADELVPLFLDALWRAGERGGHGCKLHVLEGDEGWLPAAWRQARVRVRRADGDHDEPLVEPLAETALGREWEWESTPEASLAVVEDLEDAIARFNRFAPRLLACLIAEDASAQGRFYRAIQAPFVGDGFTRWVDGQYALNRPELGLSNWEHGRLLARGAVLSGDGALTVRTRMIQQDTALDRSGASAAAPEGAGELRGPALPRKAAS
jgi:glutamate-5-semialdehyde dehydrogenase